MVTKKTDSKVVKAMGYVFFLILILISASILSVFIIITFKFSEPVFMNLAFLIGIFLSAILFKLIFNLQRKRRLRNFHIVLSGFIFMVSAQIVLLSVSPLHTLIPENILLKSGVLTPISEEKTCNAEQKYSNAKIFMGDNIDSEKIKTYYTKYFEIFFNLTKKEDLIAATTWGNFIYLPAKNQCITDITLFHELVHVWQYQKGLGFGPEWNIKWIKYLTAYLIDFDSLYDFGGFDGLVKAKQKNIRFTDFGLEQQAKIAELYYYVVTRSWPRTLQNLERSEGFNILNHFISQEFRFKL